ncbi:MAG: thiamine phosphate synthase [Candidatus Binatia bacterium]
MNRAFTLPSSLYAILDPTQSRGRPFLSVLNNLLEGGTAVVQLRAKEIAAREFLRLAVETRRHTSTAGCLFIVNDRVDIALASGADGVHLGQEDLPLAVARRLMGGKFIGISTHDLAQAMDAEQGGADYIGFGPIFGTPTKPTGYSPRGLPMLQEIRKAVKVPIVAIGGITDKSAGEVWEAGADAVAMISNLMGAEDIAGKVRRILALRQASSASSS